MFLLPCVREDGKEAASEELQVLALYDVDTRSILSEYIHAQPAQSTSTFLYRGADPRRPGSKIHFLTTF